MADDESTPYEIWYDKQSPSRPYTVSVRGHRTCLADGATLDEAKAAMVRMMREDADEYAPPMSWADERRADSIAASAERSAAYRQLMAGVEKTDPEYATKREKAILEVVRLMSDRIDTER
jgi:hypothetical protein